MYFVGHQQVSVKCNSRILKKYDVGNNSMYYITSCRQMKINVRYRTYAEMLNFSLNKCECAFTNRISELRIWCHNYGNVYNVILPKQKSLNFIYWQFQVGIQLSLTHHI